VWIFGELATTLCGFDRFYSTALQGYRNEQVGGLKNPER
jgi:hypothetical protein